MRPSVFEGLEVTIVIFVCLEVTINVLACSEMTVVFVVCLGMIVHMVDRSLGLPGSLMKLEVTAVGFGCGEAPFVMLGLDAVRGASARARARWRSRAWRRLRALGWPSCFPCSRRWPSFFIASPEFVSSECLEVAVVIFASLELTAVFVGRLEAPAPQVGAVGLLSLRRQASILIIGTRTRWRPARRGGV
ncbi:unnamed protein product [Prorocentrum cordatum]|uniref:Uncharacterized protein n=1 Tax=Prorocentrum cordatum TaxID=2364126 RepID=A0ABN9VMC5_9DINO|nr:unnamed protein product [Polarella glacialis]